MTPAQTAELETFIARRRAARARRQAHETQLRAIRAEAERTRIKNAETAERTLSIWDDVDAKSLSIHRTLRGPKPAALLARDLRRRIETDPHSARGQVAQKFAAHVAALCMKHNLRREEAQNHRAGTAWTRLLLVRVPQIRSGFSYATALHEIAHCVVAECTHPRMPMGDGRTCCAVCELRAWEWAIRTAIEWQVDAQENLSEALSSYRRYAVDPSTVAAIDALTGPDGKRHARVLRLHTTPNRLDT